MILDTFACTVNIEHLVEECANFLTIVGSQLGMSSLDLDVDPYGAEDGNRCTVSFCSLSRSFFALGQIEQSAMSRVDSVYKKNRVKKP